MKVHRKQTVDLGEYSPLEKVTVPVINLTPESVRYLFVLVDEKEIINGFILMYGKDLSNQFHFVPETSYKCQKNFSISKIYNDSIGKVVYLGDVLKSMEEEKKATLK